MSLALDPVSSPDKSELEGDGGEIASGKAAGGGEGKGAGGAFLVFRTPLGILLAIQRNGILENK
jgi:hypothetical protein